MKTSNSKLSVSKSIVSTLNNNNRNSLYTASISFNYTASISF